MFKVIFNKRFIFLIAFFFYLISPNNLFSAEGGTLTGKVIDVETGEVLRSTTVMLKGTQLGARTDVKGNFKIKNIPPGQYSLKASFVGYIAKEIANIEITNSQNIEINVMMSPEYTQTEEVVVEASRTNDNEAAMLSLRKNAGQVSDGISSEEIKKLPDSDAGQSLKRVSGITLVKDKYVFVRGVSERYSNTILNGASLATTEPDKKAFAFDIFPSDFLENANIAKTFTPDLPGNFAGGLVQLNTIDFPSGFSLKFSSSVSGTDNLTFNNNSFVTYTGGSSDWLGFDNGTRQLPGTVPSSPKLMSNLINKDIVSENITIKYNAQQKWSSMGKTFNNDVWKRDTTTAPVNGNFSLAYSNIFDLAGNDLGLITSVLYGNNYSLNAMERGVLESNGDYETHVKGTQSTFSTNLGGLFNIAYKIGGHSAISFKNTYNNSSDNEIIVLNGNRKGQNRDFRQMSYDFVQKELYAGQVTGDHSLPVFNSRLDWRVGYSQSLRDEPDFRRLRYSRMSGDKTQPFTIDIPDNPQGNGTTAGRFFSNLKEKAWTGGFNYLIPHKFANIKMGGYYETRNREFKVRSLTIVKSETIAKKFYDTTFQQDLDNWTDDAVLELLDNDTDPSAIFNEKNYYLHGLGISEDSQIRDSYKASESVTAAYIMADIPIMLGNDKLRIITGARIENSQQNLDGYYPVSFEGSNELTSPSYVNQSYLDWLPSINVVYELTKTMNLRASFSKTLTRPSLREYAPFTFYDFQTQVNVKGNTNLKRAQIQNYDLRYEWYLEPGEIFSIGGFYKIFNNAIEETILQASSETFRSYGNALGQAYNYGIEIELRKNLSILTDYLKNFSINTNLALINSELTIKQIDAEDKRSMWGQSPYSFNFGLFYFKPEWGTTLNLGYNIFGKRIIQVADVTSYQFKDPHVYELPKNQIDLSISQMLFDLFEIKFSAKDLLNEKLIWEQGGNIVSSNWGGRSYSFSVGYKIK